MSQQHHHHHHSSSSSFTSCFFPTTTADHNPSALPPPPPPPAAVAAASGKPNLTTCLYQTHLGLFSLTWSRTFLGHSVHLNLHPFDFSTPSSSPSPLSSLSTNSPSLSTVSFHLHIKPFLFWKKRGSKKLSTAKSTTNTASAAAASTIRVFWDLSRAKFGSGPEPLSGFYIAVVLDGEITLLVGDCTKEAYSRTKTQKTPRTNQVLVLRREHVVGGNKVYTTKAKFGGKTREISIDCSVNSDSKLSFSVDNKRVLQVKRLKWKFRGNERVEVDGVPIQVSWDLYNWLSEDSNNVNNNGHAVFMFRFENLDNNEEENEAEQENREEVSWQQQQQLQQAAGSCSFGKNGIEWRKMMRKSLMRTARSSSLSSISMSSASSSGCSSSVMEWASSEESELCAGSNGFSLLVYVWKK